MSACSDTAATLGAAMILVLIGACVEAADTAEHGQLRTERELGAACGAYRATEGLPEHVATPKLDSLCRSYGL